MREAVLLFSGQSSFRPDLFVGAEAAYPERTRETLAEATEILGFCPDPRAEGHPLGTNLSVQCAVFVANHLHRRLLEELGLSSTTSAGLSLGEYSHLVHIGALAYADALRLVATRGRCYDAGPEGVMAAIYPASAEELQPLVADVCAEVGGVIPAVSISNFNSPTQQVVAGATEAVQEVVKRAQEEFFAEAKLIERRIAMHTPHFAPVAERFAEALAASPWRRPQLPYLPNVTGQPIEGPGPAALVAHMRRHVFEPVRWRETIDGLVARHPDAIYVEVGPGTVVHDLLSRKWHPVLRAHSDVRAPDTDLATHHEELLDALG